MYFLIEQSGLQIEKLDGQEGTRKAHNDLPVVGGEGLCGNRIREWQVVQKTDVNLEQSFSREMDEERDDALTDDVTLSETETACVLRIDLDCLERRLGFEVDKGR